jgi:CheY-like chemotaxis protein
MRVQTLPPYRPRPPPDAVPDVVHDLRSPLNTVLGIAEVLTEGSLSAQQRSQVEMIQRAGNRMLALVNELLEVPRAHAPAGQTSELVGSMSHRREPLPSLADVRLLMVDDSEESRALVDAYLAGTGAHLTFAATGQAAREVLAREAFDIVLLDLRLPDGSGLDVVRSIRQAECVRGIAPMPVLALSADVLPTTISRSLAAGCSAHLSKPIARRTLLRAILAFRVRTDPSPSPSLEEQFLSQRVREVGVARVALERGDFERLTTLGHNLQGSGPSYGFPGMSALGKRIEKSAESKDATAVADLLIELESALSDATDASEAPPRAKSLSRVRLRAADDRVHASRKR